MSGEDDLFSGLTPANPRVSGTKDPLLDLVYEAWQTWVEMTKRPPSKMPHPKFQDTYLGYLRLRYPHLRLMDCIRAAAYVKPYLRDSDDIRRVLRVLDNEAAEAAALALMANPDSPIYTWQYSALALSSTISDVAAQCNTALDDWPAREMESAGVLCELTPDKLAEACRRVKIHIGQPSLFPSDVLRHSKVWRGAGALKPVTVAVMRDRDPYAAGATESDVMKDLRLDLDPLLEKAYLSGSLTMQQVQEQHLLAPDGYWVAVESLLDSDLSLDCSAAYASLQEEWGWHPAERQWS